MNEYFDLVNEYFLNDGFKINKTNIRFKPNNSDYINTSFGKSNFQPRKTTLKKSKVVVYSAYSKESGEDTTKILKALKGTGKVKFKPGDVENFINRSSIFFGRILRDSPIDVVIKMPSSSPLASNFTDKILEKLSHSHVLTYDDVITKDLKNISVDTSYRFSPAEFKQLHRLVDKVKESGKFEIKKVHAKLRPALINWMMIDDSIRNKLVGANILIVDDYITSGTTLDETCSQLAKFKPASIRGITLIK
jgi:hypothetical protein